MFDTNVIVGKTYTWTRTADVVIVRELERGLNEVRDLAFVEMVKPSDKKFKIGQQFWAFCDELRLVRGV